MPGNIIRLKVVTMEKTPRVLELAGEELHKVAHAYGTNGIITEVEMPLAPAYDWIDLDRRVRHAGGRRVVRQCARRSRTGS